MFDTPTDAPSPPRLSRYRTLRGRKTTTTTTSPAPPSTATPTSPVAPPTPADTALLLAEQKRKDLERLQRELDQHEARRQQQTQGHTPNMSASQELPSSPRGFFGRRRGTSVTDAQPAVADVPAVPAMPKLVTDVPAVPSLPSAPVSSVSSSTTTTPPRHIPVRWRQHTATVPITPETTVADVLFQCADVFGRRGIDPESCALVESYARIGLERRLRRYERVRDIVDSWDSDGENRLVVVDGTGGEEGIGRNGHAPDLTLLAVPRHPPPPAVVLLPLHHSQKPGRWTKRYLTLVPQTGQLVASGKAKDQAVLAMLQAAEEGKDTTTTPTSSSSSSSSSSVLLHLSDYDIGTPTPAHTRKRLRPPAMTVCFAVRSQHRSTMFVSTDNYVHMFAAADPAQARQFYDAVFAWRSWYLVHRKLGLAAATTDRGQPAVVQKTPTVPAVPLLPMKTVGGPVGGPKNLPLGRSLSTRQPDRADRADGVHRPERRPTYDERTTHRPEHRPEHRPRSPPSDDDDDDDIPLGLQFPQFQRQQQQQQQQQKEQRPPRTPTAHTSRPPTTTARSPPARSPPARSPSGAHHHHQHHPHPGRIPPAPLIDLTPAFHEPPQWSRDKRGRGVRAPPGTALVDLARGPLDALMGPAVSTAPPLVSRRTQTMTTAGTTAVLATAPLVPRSQSQGPQAPALAQRLAHRAREEYR